MIMVPFNRNASYKTEWLRYTVLIGKFTIPQLLTICDLDIVYRTIQQIHRNVSEKFKNKMVIIIMMTMPDVLLYALLTTV